MKISEFPLKGFARAKETDPEHLAPCDKDCWYWMHCKQFHLACKQFNHFVQWNHDLDPPPGGWMHKDAPTRGRYSQAFPEDFE